MRLYGIKNCGSVKKALAFFKAKGIAIEFVDFKSTPVDQKKIAQWVKAKGIGVVLNTKGTTYRNLKLGAMDLSEVQKIEQMDLNNLLIKRPVIEHEGGIVVGFDEDLYGEVFK